MTTERGEYKIDYKFLRSRNLSSCLHRERHQRVVWILNVQVKEEATKVKMSGKPALLNTSVRRHFYMKKIHIA